MSEPLTIENILELLPHRYPFLLVDKVLDYEPFNFLNAVKNVTLNEPFFNGHFPDYPIMPGVLILEALAQASGILYGKSLVPKPGMKFRYFFAGIDNARFKSMVRPGDCLQLKVKVVKHKRDIWKIHGEAYVGEELACSADLLSAAKEVECD